MKKESMDSVLKEVLKRVEPPEQEMKSMKSYLDQFIQRFEKRCAQRKIRAEIFIGGSFAKKTVIKKNSYDIDIFLRFDPEYLKEKRDISELAREILDLNQEKYMDVKGSRNYFRIKVDETFSLEIIPVIKVKNPQESENITDLSYSHVKYINKKIKDQKMLDEIKIAKAFCYSCNAYGAESYIKGFSGYALELLIYHYKSFRNFIKAVAKTKDKEKLVIDIERFYKNKSEVMMNLNTAKLQAPIILIDPTYKQRNVCAALSEETFKQFRYSCNQFLKNPSIKWFEEQTLDLEKIKKNALTKKQEFCIILLETDRQEGDIAGTKLLKFYEHMYFEIDKYFQIKGRGFGYDGMHKSQAWFVVKSRKEIEQIGPRVKDKENVKAFKKRHKKVIVKKGRLVAKDKINFTIQQFFENWKEKNSGKIREMDITGLRIL
ncbi:CCA-adding enzyme [uncultured archaeon]|nr:CCA-adding enzyme [uncultured archaeon]